MVLIGISRVGFKLSVVAVFRLMRVFVSQAMAGQNWNDLFRVTKTRELNHRLPWKGCAAKVKIFYSTIGPNRNRVLSRAI